MRKSHLDLHLLQTLVAVIDHGGFIAASRALNCTQSAVTHQLQRLEERAATSLFERHGRQKRLTPTGELLLDYARRILDLHEEALRVMMVTGTMTVRVGLPEHLAAPLLPPLLKAYSERFPETRIDVRLARSPSLREMADLGQLDCALSLSLDVPEKGELAQLPLAWLASPSKAGILARGRPLSLVTLDDCCAFRRAMIGALEKAGTPWQIAYSASSVAELCGAVRAGRGVTAMIGWAACHGMVEVPGLPPLPRASVGVHYAPAIPRAAARDFMQVITGIFRDAGAVVRGEQRRAGVAAAPI